jgi:hypothetical protein
MILGTYNPSYYKAIYQDINPTETTVLLCGEISGGPLLLNNMKTGFVMELNMNLMTHYVHTFTIDVYSSIP